MQTIVYLETGTGKTHIAAMLVKHFVDQLRAPHSNIAFLVRAHRYARQPASQAAPGGGEQRWRVHWQCGRGCLDNRAVGAKLLVRTAAPHAQLHNDMAQTLLVEMHS
jgi:hypothetical protein